jgi:hypothetical protein
MLKSQRMQRRESNEKRQQKKSIKNKRVEKKEEGIRKGNRKRA